MTYEDDMFVKVSNGTLVGCYKDSTNTQWPSTYTSGSASSGSIDARLTATPTLSSNGSVYTFTIPVFIEVNKTNVYAGNISGNLVVTINMSTKSISCTTSKVITGNTSSSFALVEISDPLLFLN